MKIRYIFLMLIFFSACNDNMDMQNLPVLIVFNKNISDNPKELMPDGIKAFIKPIEGKDGEGKNIAFVPQIRFCRLDLNKDSVSIFEVPKESADKIRSAFGTYDYSNLKDNYAETLPKLEIGSYLTQPSSKKAAHKFQNTSDDMVFIYDPNSKDSILDEIKNFLFVKRNIPKRIVIFYDRPAIDKPTIPQPEPQHRPTLDTSKIILYASAIYPDNSKNNGGVITITGLPKTDTICNVDYTLNGKYNRVSLQSKNGSIVLPELTEGDYLIKVIRNNTVYNVRNRTLVKKGKNRPITSSHRPKDIWKESSDGYDNGIPSLPKKDRFQKATKSN